MSAQKWALVTIAITLIFGVWISSASAMGGKLDSPTGIALSASYPASVKKQILETLGQYKSNYIEGHFVNRISVLNFNGDTAVLNELTQKLTECPSTTVTILFR